MVETWEGWRDVAQFQCGFTTSIGAVGFALFAKPFASFAVKSLIDKTTARIAKAPQRSHLTIRMREQP